MSEEWKKEFFEWKDEIESKFNNLSQKHSELEKWKKIEEEQHQNITKALDNFVIDAGAIGDSVYSNKLKSFENEIAELREKVDAWIDDIRIGNKQRFNLEEVLRELHELIRGLVADLQDSNSLSKATMKCYEGKLIKNLEKLVSKSIHNDPILKECQEKFKEMEKQAEKKDPWHDYEEVTDPITKVTVKIKKEKLENPYLDLGMITSKDGELSDYNPSQFVRDYAKTHTLFSLYGLVSPEEDSGGER